jgi:mycothiol synthase
MTVHEAVTERETAAIQLEPVLDLEAALPAMWRVANAARQADGELDRNTLEGFSAYYRHLEHCDPRTDMVVARRGSALVAYARVEWTDTTDGERWYESVCFVDPPVRRRGLGRRLLAWTETRRLELVAADAAAGAAADRPRSFTTFIHDGDTGGEALLRSSGYEPFRRFHSMRRDALDDIREAPLPDGLEIREIPNTREAIRAVIAADAEAFQDHFGSVDDVDTVVRQILDDPSTDTSQWVVAFDGDEIAAGVINGVRDDDDGVPTGWLDSVFTRRPWRKRGLARALIVRSLQQLRDRGVASAALGVDAANPNQALRLYESCGFRVASSSTVYRKPIPERPHD